MTDNNYPKYQYSTFDKAGGQIVVRTDDKEDFGNLINFAKAQAKLNGSGPYVEAAKNNAAVTEEEFSKDHICPSHGVQMKERVSKKTGKPYFSHSKKEGEEWLICFGKGWSK